MMATYAQIQLGTNLVPTEKAIDNKYVACQHLSMSQKKRNFAAQNYQI